MSKATISRDRWRQLGQSRYHGMCPGCGFHFAANGEHRADCTAKPVAHTDGSLDLVGVGHLSRRCPHCGFYWSIQGHRENCSAGGAR